MQAPVTLRPRTEQHRREATHLQQNAAGSTTQDLHAKNATRRHTTTAPENQPQKTHHEKQERKKKKHHKETTPNHNETKEKNEPEHEKITRTQERTAPRKIHPRSPQRQDKPIHHTNPTTENTKNHQKRKV